MIWQHGIRTSAEHLDVVGHGWLAQLRENFAARGLLRFIIFSSWTSFWMAFADTFTLFVVLATVSGIFGWWFWGRKVDRNGCVLILVIGLALWELLNMLWAVLDRGNTWLLYPLMLLGGFVSVGYFAASFNLLLKLVPASSKVTGVSLHLALTSLTGAIASIAPHSAGYTSIGTAAREARFAIKRRWKTA